MTVLGARICLYLMVLNILGKEAELGVFMDKD